MYLLPERHRAIQIDGQKEVARPEEDHVRVVCIADTHETHEYITVPNGDLLIVAGDILFCDECSLSNSLDRLRSFNAWLGKLPHKEKIVIGGNHDFTLQKIGRVEARKVLTNAVYLEDDSRVVCGLRIYGSPVSCGKSENKAFQVPKNKLLEHLDIMPQELDILIVHGISERLQEGISEKFQPRFIISGHHHDQYGFSFSPTTTFINASTVEDLLYLPVNPPVVFDVLYR